MTVDLSNLQPGDSVVFRNGGKLKVDSFRHRTHAANRFDLTFQGYVLVFSYKKHGEMNCGEINPLDIIAIDNNAVEKKTPLEEWMQDNEIWSFSGASCIQEEIYDLVEAINETVKGIHK